MYDVFTGHDDSASRYEIRVNGHLAPRWAVWFDGMSITPHDDGTTLIHGTVTDQSALHGLLHKVSDLGLALLSVTSQAHGDARNRNADPSRPNGPGPTNTRSTR